MRIVLVAVVLILTEYSSYAQQKDCRQFHKGTFTNVNEETGVTTLIERNSNTQTETTDGGKSKAEFTIKWINDCTYILSPTKATYKLYPDWPKNTVFTVEIIETDNDSYQQVSSSSLNETKITNVIKRLK